MLSRLGLLERTTQRFTSTASECGKYDLLNCKTCDTLLCVYVVCVCVFVCVQYWETEACTGNDGRSGGRCVHGTKSRSESHNTFTISERPYYVLLISNSTVDM